MVPKSQKKIKVHYRVARGQGRLTFKLFMKEEYVCDCE